MDEQAKAKERQKFIKKPDYNMKILKFNKNDVLTEAVNLDETVKQLRNQNIEINDSVKEVLKNQFPLLSNNLNVTFTNIIETKNFNINILVEMINGIYTIGENHVEGPNVRVKIANLLNKTYIEDVINKKNT
jgi:predicted phage-related endonuclease